jgi:hypothetical protein
MQQQVLNSMRPWCVPFINIKSMIIRQNSNNQATHGTILPRACVAQEEMSTIFKDTWKKAKQEKKVSRQGMRV